MGRAEHDDPFAHAEREETRDPKDVRTVPTRGMDERTPQRRTLARAALTFCLDGADALMYALLKGSDDPAATLDLLIEARGDGRAGNAARAELDRLFVVGLAKWGGHADARGMGVFHRALAGWQTRLDRLPTLEWELLGEWFTVGGEQWIIGPESPHWPRQLQDLSTRRDWASPLCLWGLGDPSALTCCAEPVAVVGSRNVTDYGCAVARDVAMTVASGGHLVVSGGALGADAAAHWGALAALDGAETHDAGRTVAVFAGGLRHIGPSANMPLFDAIRESGGALISELCPGTVPEARRFLLRNRIIAALSSTVVVTQARLRSGALNTANWACDLTRGLVAVPGPITSPHNAGCNRLIASGKATILTSPAEITDLIHAPHRV